MIKSNDIEIMQFIESIYGEKKEVFLVENFSEWEKFQSIHEEIYEAAWNNTQLFYDIFEMSCKGYFNEGPPSRPQEDRFEVPDIARKQVTISPKMAYLGLPQVPPRAAGGLFTNNLTSSNPTYYRYIGHGFYGALRDREMGKAPQNWVKEIRYVVGSKPIAPHIIDRVTNKPIPNLGAVTNRPIKENEPQIPPDWNEYSPKKASAFSDEEGNKYHGVYVGYDDTIKQLETPIGHKIKLTQGGYYDDKDTGEKVYKGSGGGIRRGEIEADLSPPIKGDPDSYLGIDTKDGQPKISPRAAGYWAQALDTSKARANQWGQYKYLFTTQPQIFDQRLLRVLLNKQNKQQLAKQYGDKTLNFTPSKYGQIPTTSAPITRNAVRREPYDGKHTDYGKAYDYRDNPPTWKGYYRRMWVPDPTEPGRKILDPVKQVPASPEYLEKMKNLHMLKLEKLSGILDSLKAKKTNIIQKYKGNPALAQSDPEYIEISKNLKKFKSQYYDAYLNVQNYHTGQQTTFDPQEIGRYGSLKVPYTDEEIEQIKATGRDPATGETIKNQYRFIKRGKFVKDEEGEKIKRPIMGAAWKTQLKNNYHLIPIPGDPIVLSKEFLPFALRFSNRPQKNEARNISSGESSLMESARTNEDKIFARYYAGYGLRALSNGTFFATRQVNTQARKIWSWAKTDEKGNLFFVYRKDRNEHTIPVYFPGTVDGRKPGKPTIAGGFESAPTSAPETRVIRDKRREQIALTGVDPQTNERIFDGWQAVILESAQKGVGAGLKALEKTLRKFKDFEGNSGTNHYQYKDLANQAQDMQNEAYIYMQYNLRNSKFIDIATNEVGHLDERYIKDTFTHLYAALKQYDKWLNAIDPATNKPNRMTIKMGTKSLFDLSFVQLQKFMDRMKHVAGDDIGQIKIRKEYIKRGLKDHVSDMHFAPVRRAFNRGEEVSPPDAPTFTHTDFNNNKTSYQLLNLNINTLNELLNEARRNYLVFAAKDMVIKIWQHKYPVGAAGTLNQGDDRIAATLANIIHGDDDDKKVQGGLNAQDKRLRNKGSYSEKLKTMRPSELLAYFKSRKDNLLNQQQELKTAEITPENTVDPAIANISIKLGLEETDSQKELLEEIIQGVKNDDKSYSPEQFDVEVMKRFAEQLPLWAEKKRKASMAANIYTKPEGQHTPLTLDKFYSSMTPDKLLNDPNISDLSNKLIKISSKNISDVAEEVAVYIQRLGSNDLIQKAQNTITYNVLKNLERLSPSLNENQRKFWHSASKLLKNEYVVLFDLADLVPQVIPLKPEQEQKSTPARSGLGGRINKKAV